jgi:dTMP kinase
VTLAGRFIVLDGIDGSGTTTQGQRLVAALQAAGVSARFTCEPSAGPIGRQIRQLLSAGGEEPSHAWDTLALLFAADRLDHLAREVRPALSAGTTVVCDRYDLSSLAYQSATAPEPAAAGAAPAAAGQAALAWIRALNQRALRPDLTIVLDVDPDVAEARRAARGQPAELFERRDLQRRLARLYAAAEALVPGDRLVHISADAGLEEVAARLWAAVTQAFAAR